MRFRADHRGDETSPTAKKFRHSSRHTDLESLLADHMLGSDAAAATADWLPSRRGNSPREDRPASTSPEAHGEDAADPAD